MKTLFLMLLIILIAACPVYAEGQKTSLIWTEQYRWHGIEVFGKDYVHPGVSTSVGGIDFSAVTHLGDAHDNIEYWDTIVGYKLPVAGLDMKVGYGYLIFPGVDIQEISATVSLPGTISPRYTISHAIPDEGDSGQFHVFGADLFLGEPDKISAVLMGDITFNDYDPDIRDFTHTTCGAVLNVPVGKVVLSPAVFWQHTLEPAISDNVDEVWFAVSASYEF